MSDNTQPPWHEAPDDAEYAAFNRILRRWTWCKNLSCQGCEWWAPDGTWVRQSAPFPNSEPLIPRPQPEQEWEKGVPPVGWHGEVIWGTKTDWRECVILPGHRVAWDDFGRGWNTGNIWDNAEFRPLRSPRDRAIEHANKATGSRWSPEFCDDVFGGLYDAGLLREAE